MSVNKQSRKTFALCLFCLMLPIALFSQSAVKIDDSGLTNMYRIDKDLYRSEQPEKQHFKALEKYGIREIVNLRFLHSDAKKMRGTGIVEHRVRMQAHNITDYDVIRALKTIKNRKSPLLIHCRHGADRTGVIVAAYRVVFLNKSKKEAIDEMVNGGFGFHPIYKNIVRYVENLDVDYIKKEMEKDKY